MLYIFKDKFENVVNINKSGVLILLKFCFSKNVELIKTVSEMFRII